MNLAAWTKVLWALAPLEAAWSTDNPGRQMGDSRKQIKRVLICLDCSPYVITQATKLKIDLIISFHPLFWPNRRKNLQTDPDKKTDYLALKKAKIAVFSMHTNYENRILSRELLEKFTTQTVQSKDLISETVLRPAKTIKAIIEECKKIFQLQHVDYWCQTTLKAPVKRLGLVSGSGGHALATIKNKKFDLLITGDLKWHQWHKIVRDRQNTIVVGHHMEEAFLPSLRSKLLATAIGKTVKIFTIAQGRLFNKI